MVRDFPTDVIVEVLYETGTKRPKTISRKSGICLRTVQRYVSKLKQGLPPSRNPYKKRKGKVTSAIRKRVFTLPWPTYSPDLSPIENIWAWIKEEIAKDRPSTIKSLKRSLRKHWKRLTPEFLEPYFASMPNRMRMVINNHGNRINY